MIKQIINFLIIKFKTWKLERHIKNVDRTKRMIYPSA